LAIEIDGLQHIEGKKYDIERSDYLSMFGIKVIRFWNNEVGASINNVLDKIINELNF